MKRGKEKIPNRQRKFGRQKKIVLCNIIMMLISVAAIVTLFTGCFMSLEVVVNLDGEILADFVGNEGGEGEESSGEGGGGPLPAAAEGTEMSSDELIAAFTNVKISIPVGLTLTSRDLLDSLVRADGGSVEDIISRESGKIIEVLLNKADEILPRAIGAIVNVAVVKAENEVKRQILEQTGNGKATEEQIMEKLEEEHNVKKEDIDEMETEITDAVAGLLSGEKSAEDISDMLKDSATLDKLVSIYAEEELKNEGGEGEEITEERKKEKVDALKQEVVDQYDETIRKMKDEGILTDDEKFDKNKAVVGIINSAGIAGEEEGKIESIDDVKKLAADKINDTIAGGRDIMVLVLQILGGFVLAVMAAWAYFLLKLIVKTIFCRQNKTVGMFAPKFFGWMPHVIFVGLPMLVIKNLDKIASLLVDTLGLGEEIGDIVDKLSSFVEINVNSLTWVSAVCAALLAVIWIPYYRWRRQLKKEKRLARKEAKAGTAAE